MDVFISWAGKRSLAVAEALKDWIPMLINAAKPWLSKAHIPTGKLWRKELAESLASCKFGIFCLTHSSLSSNWMFFEAGAISKTLSDAHVCPVLIDVKVSEVESPFADFQCRLANKEGILALMETLNAALPDETSVPEAQLQRSFELLWPALATRLAQIPSDEGPKRPQRNTEELLEEILKRVRALEQRPSNESSKSQHREGMAVYPSGVPMPDRSVPSLEEVHATTDLLREKLRALGYPDENLRVSDLTINLGPATMSPGFVRNLLASGTFDSMERVKRFLRRYDYR